VQQFIRKIFTPKVTNSRAGASPRMFLFFMAKKFTIYRFDYQFIKKSSQNL
jgi:hypothetical protein